MNNFKNNHNGFNSGHRPSAFKIWHAKNHSETLISITNEFCKVVQNAILSNYCENKALVAFAKQLCPSPDVRTNGRNSDNSSYNRAAPSYGRSGYYDENSVVRGHHADIDEYLDDLE